MKNWCSVFLVACLCSSGIGEAAELMGTAQETAVVQKYCGSCHSDALMYGGLSVQHFDAAQPDPTLTAMLLSKITNGHTPKDVSAADSAGVLKMMKASAMGAAGQGVPDEESQVMFSRALALQSAGAYDWNIAWENTDTSVASILREKPSVKYPGVTDSYRLIVRCRASTRAGEIKVAWANAPAGEGQMMSVAVDGAEAFQHKVEGGRAQGNGNNGPGATILKIPLPTQSLTVSNLFGEGNVVFPFGALSQATRRELAVCFPTDEAAK
jgi:hypothetical protein